ncbi:unnamed protein product, partial [Mesorhabditis spiculigera]
MSDPMIFLINDGRNEKLHAHNKLFDDPGRPGLRGDGQAAERPETEEKYGWICVDWDRNNASDRKRPYRQPATQKNINCR